MAMQFQDFDCDYLDRLRSGDFRTQQHFAAYFGELIRLKAAKRLLSIAAVEDVRQETLTRVLRLLTEQQLRQPERFGAFVNSVCNNVLHEHHRARTRELPVDGEVANAIVDPGMSALEAIARRQLHQKVRQTLDELPEKDRCLLKAVFLEERSKDELCCEFGVTRDYLRVLVYRAKQSFKSYYLRATRKIPARTRFARAASFLAHNRTEQNEPFPLIHRLKTMGRGT
jgi:RNA polymerase sigma-70 factor, ECF subfamily